MQRDLSPSETQRSGFARERRSNEAIRSFRRKAETERAQFAPTRRRLSSSGCRRYDICFSKPAEKRRRKARAPVGTNRIPVFIRAEPNEVVLRGRGGATKRYAVFAARRKRSERSLTRRGRSAAGDLCLRKKEGDPFCIRRPSGVMRIFRMTPPGGGGNPENPEILKLQRKEVQTR